MTLTQFKYVLAVDRCRNFAQAAKECFVTQPTLSAQIHKLEDYLQVSLFDRSQVPVVPTPMGEKIIQFAKEIIEGSNRLEEFSRSLRGEISGEFILAVIPTVAPYVLPLFIHPFVEKFPQVQLKIYEYQTDDIICKLKEGKLDGAILATPLELKEIKEEHLFFEPFKVFFSPKHPLLKQKAVLEKDLSLDEAWLLKEGHCLRTQALNICHVHHSLHQRGVFFEAGSLETLVHLVKTTKKSFTILPALACQNLSINDLKLVRDFKDKLPVRDISFVIGPHSVKDSIKNELIKMIQSLIPAELTKEKKKTEIINIF